MKTKVKLETEKTIQLSDLQNTDHIGFYTRSDGKGYVSTSINRKLVPVAIDNTDSNPVAPVSMFGSDAFKEIQDLINSLNRWGLNELYVFTTRKELYQWLAE